MSEVPGLAAVLWYLGMGTLQSMLWSGQGTMVAPDGQERCSDESSSVLMGQQGSPNPWELREEAEPASARASPVESVGRCLVPPLPAREEHTSVGAALEMPGQVEDAPWDSSLVQGILQAQATRFSPVFHGVALQEQSLLLFGAWRGPGLAGDGLG